MFARDSYTHTSCNHSWPVQLPHRCLWSLQNFSRSWLVCGPQCWKKSSSVIHAPVLSEQVPSHPSLCFPQGIITSQHKAFLLQPCIVLTAVPATPLAGGSQSSQGPCRLWQEFNLLTEIDSEQLQIFLGFSAPFLASCVAAGSCAVCAAFTQVFQEGNMQQIKERGCKRVAAALGLLERLFYRRMNRQFVVRHCFLNIAWKLLSCLAGH